MRICYLAAANSIHTARWANHFASKGHQVEVLSFESLGKMDSSVRVHRIGRRLPLRMQYLSYGKIVRNLIQQLQPDILHAHYASGYATLGRLARFHPFVVSVWGSDIFDFPRKSPLHRKLVLANLNAADRLCSTSRVMAKEIWKYCRKDVDVTPFGVDCQCFCPRVGKSNDGGEFVVGIVKTLEPKYGVEYLIRAFSIFSGRFFRSRKLRLVIGGTGSLSISLKRLTRDLGIAAETTFLGYVQHEKVPEILRQFSVFVTPSLLESFGVAVIEASASGLPVVVSRIGGLPEVVKDRVTGILVPPRDPEAIASALQELMDNEVLRRELGRNGRKFVLENYEWKENASRMEGLYESLLAGRGTVPVTASELTPS